MTNQIQATVSAISNSGGSESVTLGSTTSDEITFNLVSGMSPAGALATIGSLYQPVTHPTTPYRNESSYVAWTSYQYSHKQLVGTSVYSVIPTDGTAGTAGVNYDQTQYGYNAIGDQVWTKTPAGTITWNVLDARGLVASTWVGTDDVPTSDYNGDGSHNAADFAFWLAANPTATQGPSGTDMVEAATAAYNADGLATSTTQHADSSSAHDRTTAYGYDWRDRLLSTMVYDGTHYTYTYNTYDNLNEVLQTQGYQAATAWTVNPAGDTLLSQATTAYDGLGEVYHSSTYVEDTTQSPHVWTAQTTNYWYDADGNERKLEDPDGNTTSWSYDGLGELVVETTPILKSPGVYATDQYRYDGAGELIEQIDGDGRAITYTYDGMGREVGENWYASVDGNGNPQGSPTETVSYAYNAAGLLSSASDANSSYTYTYDAAGEETGETQQLAGLTPTISFAEQYTAGNRTQLAASIGSTSDFVNNYQYQGIFGQMSQVTQSGVSGGDAVAAKAVTFSYDNLGEFLTIARYADLAKTEQVAQSTYGYDLDGNLTSLTYANANSTLPSYAWTYDPLGNMA